MIKITTTYQIVSPESAEVGDVEEQGFYDEVGEVFESVSEAVEFLNDHYVVHPSEYPSENSKSWSTDGDTDYPTGNITYYTYHIDTDSETLQEINKTLIEKMQKLCDPLDK